ncbi:MAG: hypothetical protein LQ340_001518 [Diploschistes diacapsis]|nr:MAG: hypothetical protein LQ340_001518 [Diploschistes diacapsis]
MGSRPRNKEDVNPVLKKPENRAYLSSNVSVSSTSKHRRNRSKSLIPPSSVSEQGEGSGSNNLEYPDREPEMVGSKARESLNVPGTSSSERGRAKSRALVPGTPTLSLGPDQSPGMSSKETLARSFQRSLEGHQSRGGAYATALGYQEPRENQKSEDAPEDE